MKKLLLLFCIFSSFFVVFSCPRLTPSISVSYSNTCGTPRNATITNTTTGSDSAVSKYKYYLNGILVDSQTGRTNPPDILITGTGNNRITMIVTDTAGCVDSSFTTVNITTSAAQVYDQNSALSYSPSWINCIQLSTAPDSFQITTSSNDTLRNPIFIWGDGTSNTYSSNQIPNTNFSHWYISSGIFTLKIVQRSGTCTDTIYGTVSNLRQPTAGLIGPGPGANTGCVPHNLTMTNNSSNIGVGTVFTWDWADGFTSTQNYTQANAAITHTYNNFLCNGTVRLTATNACGSSFTTWNPINISEPDLAEFSIDSSNCNPSNPYTFYNQSADRYCLLPDQKQYYWDWGDGTNTGWITSSAAQTHIYSTTGAKTIMLITRNGCGDDTISHSFNVVFTPTVGFLIDTTSGCGTATVFVDDTSSGYNITRQWDFGDGSTSTADTVTHFYSTPGTYTLRLSITNRCGTQFTNQTIRVYNYPRAYFNDTLGGCAPVNFNPTNQSTTDFASAQYFWDFGNGTTSSMQTPGITSYTVPGSYTVKLRVTDGCGIDSLLSTIPVDSTPTALVITDTTVCAFDTLFFTNNASSYQYLITNFGDGTAPDTQTVNGTFFHIYNVPGLIQAIHTAKSPSGCVDRDTNNILVRSSASARFTVNQTQACAPFTFQFTNTSLYANKYRWYLDGVLQSSTSVLNDIVVNTDSTVHTIKLWAIDSTSCYADSVERTIFTARDPIAIINKSIDSACAPLSDTLRNGSQFSTNYIWSLGNGNTSTQFEPTTIYTASVSKDTNYAIRLIAQNWLGCADSTYGNRKIFPKPTVNFSTNRQTGCGPLNVQFTNNSIPNDTGSIAIMTFNWDFGNGNTSSSQNTNSSFSANNARDTSYKIILTGYSEHQCVEKDSTVVTVFPQPVVNFTMSDSQGCAPLSINFTNNSIPQDTGSIAIMTFNWNLGNGQMATSKDTASAYFASATQDSVYSIKLIGYTEHGCFDSLTRTAKVFPKPRVRFTKDRDSGCAPLQVQFTNNSIPNDTGSIAIMTFNWNFGNGNTSTARDSSISYNQQPRRDTVYNIRLIGASEHGCLDTFNDQVKVHPLPNPFFSADKYAGCGPLTVNFTSTSTLANQHHWDFGNGFSLGTPNMTHTFQAANLVDTLYNVQLYVVSSQNCFSPDTFGLPIVVRANPIANFVISDDSICREQLSLFYNLSQGASIFKWHFDDGDSSTRYNPVHQYTPSNNPFMPVVFSIKLEATNFFGCKDSIRRDLYVFPSVTAAFTVDRDSACAPLFVNYTNNSINNTASFWEFGDGDTSSLTNPSHRFDNYTTQNITYRTILRASNQYGCIDYDSANLTTIPVPLADFTPIRNDICDSGYFNLVNRSKNAPMSFWDFGDGTTDTATNPKHLFKRSIYRDTAYTITLRVSNSHGCFEEITRTITLPVRMQVKFDTTPFRTVCQPAAVTFNNRTTFSTYQTWFFGDGGIKTDSIPTHIYVKPGRFGVKLIAYDKNSCPDSFVSYDVVEVLTRPIANFTYNPTGPKMPNANVFFSSLSSPNGLTHIWKFGDGDTSRNVNPMHLYGDSGTYTITLVVTNGTCNDTITQDIYVEPPFPTIDFFGIDTAGCGPLTVQFFENTINATSFRWIFDDGQESTLPNPIHTFTLPGYYNITLRAYGPGGSSFLTKDSFVFVYPKPNALFAASPRTRYLPNAQFTLIDGSADATSYAYLITHDSLPIYRYTSTEANPQFQLSVPGYYTVRLIVTSALGCTDTSVRIAHLYVAAEGRVLVPNAFTPNNDGNNDVFMPVLKGVVDTEYSFLIYDRWGMKIFEGNKISDFWDGTYQTKPAMQDAYIWLISGKFVDGTYFEEKGNVTLLR